MKPPLITFYEYTPVWWAPIVQIIAAHIVVAELLKAAIRDAREKNSE